MDTLVVFGFGVIAIVYWLISKARSVRIIVSPKAAYWSGCTIWFVLTVLWALAQNPRPPLYYLVLIWLGGWVATMLFKDGVKRNETKSPDRPQG